LTIEQLLDSLKGMKKTQTATTIDNPQPPAKQRIVEAAIEMFNQQGTLAVSTNHIAKHAGVSPGTLYYHFRTKNDIIYAIMEKIRGYDQQVFTDISAHPSQDKLAFFNFVLQSINRHNWQFRFFKRDMTALCAGDEELAQRYEQFQQSRIEYLQQFIKFAILIEIFNPLSPDTLQFLANQLWLNIHYWNLHLVNNNREVNQQNIAELEIRIRHLLLPYFTDPIALKVQEQLDNKEIE